MYCIYTVQRAVMLCGWKVNVGLRLDSGVALAMRHRHIGIPTYLLKIAWKREMSNTKWLY